MPACPAPANEALHPEVEGLDPEDYPDITKFSILADVALYSDQSSKCRNIVDKESRGNPDPDRVNAGLHRYACRGQIRKPLRNRLRCG
jgi:hypothetical protein